MKDIVLREDFDIDRYKNKYNTTSNRHKYHDYKSISSYFITICVKNRENVLSNIINNHIDLSEFGEIVDNISKEMPNKFPHILLDDIVIMPNHVHLIIVFIHRGRDAINRVSTSRTVLKDSNIMGTKALGEIIRWFKGRCTFEINKISNNFFFSWQSNYHDIIIKNNNDYLKMKNYIYSNPLKWEKDQYFM